MRTTFAHLVFHRSSQITNWRFQAADQKLKLDDWQTRLRKQEAAKAEPRPAQKSRRRQFKRRRKNKKDKVATLPNQCWSISVISQTSGDA